MKKTLLLLFLPLCLICCRTADAAVYKLGQKPQKKMSFGSGRSETVASGISCLENKDCDTDQECVTLQCVNVCQNATCSDGLHCAPAGKEKPHEYRCVECSSHKHCPEGMLCTVHYTCQKPDPCKDAVCSPAAPFCRPKPYKTLPYTCVQCETDEHCPPVAGLTRKCVDGYCLFNVEGNIPAQKQIPEAQTDPAEQPPQQDAGEYEDEYYGEEYYD